MPKKPSNARRFINAYNEIDYSLRAQYNFKRSMSFSDLIRKAVVVNHIVRKYEDCLVDYGRLRNAIIHRSSDEFIIAEPHDDVTLKIEKIARLVTTPPTALSVCNEDVLTVDHDVSLENVIRLMAEYSYSNLPVYNNGLLIGIANGQKILENLGEQILKNCNVNDYLKNTKIEDALINASPYRQYEVLPASATIEQVLDLYYKNRKLLAVLITKEGTMNEPPLGILTTTSVMEMNNIIENF